MDKELDALTK